MDLALRENREKFTPFSVKDAPVGSAFPDSARKVPKLMRQV
jgi:hypothetical protein